MAANEVALVDGMAREILEGEEPVEDDSEAPASPTFEDFEAELTSHGEYEHDVNHDFDDEARTEYDPLDSIESEDVHVQLKRRESVLEAGENIDLDAEMMALESELSTMGLEDDESESDQDLLAEYDRVAQELGQSIPLSALTSHAHIDEMELSSTESVKPVKEAASVLARPLVDAADQQVSVIGESPSQIDAPVDVAAPTPAGEEVCHEVASEVAHTHEDARDASVAFEVDSDFGELGGIEEFSSFNGAPSFY